MFKKLHSFAAFGRLSWRPDEKALNREVRPHLGPFASEEGINKQLEEVIRSFGRCLTSAAYEHGNEAKMLMVLRSRLDEFALKAETQQQRR